MGFGRAMEKREQSGSGGREGEKPTGTEGGVAGQGRESEMRLGRWLWVDGSGVEEDDGLGWFLISCLWIHRLNWLIGSVGRWMEKEEASV